MNGPSGPRSFATTQWSLVRAADPRAGSRARAALEQLCRAYWYPLYAFVRGRGHSADDAQDLTQAFFASLLETGGFAAADPGRGRFRSYLLGAMKHFLANEWHRARAQKRGGQLELVEWDALEPERRYADAAAPTGDPDLLFDRQWALETTGAALELLRAELEGAGKGEEFDALKGCLTGREEATRADLAARLGMTGNALKVAIHRLRQRYRVLLRAVVAETVSDEAELEEELRYLASVLRGG